MSEKPLFLELFAGSRSLGVIAEAMGYDVISLDFTAFHGIDLVMDILDFDLSLLDRSPALIWASPPCTTYSIASIGHHRNGPEPTSDEARLADRILCHTVKILTESNALWYLENPRGMMRKMSQVALLERRTVTYCSYGGLTMKPTDIWSNNHFSLFNPSGWRPRPLCYNSNPFCAHMPSPRGSQGGIQSLGNAYERSKLPADLCAEILSASLPVIVDPCLS